MTRECGADPALRRELEELLDHATDSATLVGSAVDAAIRLEREGPRIGDRLGAYRLLEILGRGGLSTVYLAERADLQYEQRVAVKVIRLELDSLEMRDRLRQERQILAALNHPNIAGLLDGGTSPEGLPFFVMEHIEGLDLETYCRQNSLGLKARLELFRRLCEAVSFAHRKLIIHRDLKPANILVTRDGTPKLLDFGIAKPLERFAALTLAPTAPGHRLLTFAFASPEQVAGEPLSTATDIYSLGVVLYRLLAGRHPYDLEGATPGVAEARIREVEPPRPSLAAAADDGRDRGAAGPAAWAHRLRGDLDTIVLKAVHKDPERRYGSVEQLSDDLARYLDGRPVEARGDSWLYRGWRFVRRHRLAVAVAAGVLALSVVYIVQLAVERDRARQEARKTAKISEVMIGLFQSSDPNQARGAQMTARELLDRGALRIRQDFEEEPLVRAEMMDVIGQVYGNLGLTEPARSLLEEALEIRQAQLDDPHLDIAASRDHLAVQLVEARELEAAEELFTEALESRRAGLGKSHPETLLSLNNLAAVKAYRGDLETAEDLFRKVLERRQRQFGLEHSDVATSLHNLADVLDRQGKGQAAEQYYRLALDIKRRLEGDDSPGVALSLNNLGRLAELRGALDEARELYGEALEVNRRLVDEIHPDVVFGLRRMASIADRQGDRANAETLLRAGLETLRRHPEAPDPVVAPLLEDLAELLLNLGRLDEGEPLARESLDRRQRAAPDGDWRVAASFNLIGAYHLAAGRLEQARPLLESSHQQLLERFGGEHPRVLRAERRLAALKSALQEDCDVGEGPDSE